MQMHDVPGPELVLLHEPVEVVERLDVLQPPVPALLLRRGRTRWCVVRPGLMVRSSFYRLPHAEANRAGIRLTYFSPYWPYRDW